MLQLVQNVGRSWTRRGRWRRGSLADLVCSTAVIDEQCGCARSTSSTTRPYSDMPLAFRKKPVGGEFKASTDVPFAFRKQPAPRSGNSQSCDAPAAFRKNAGIGKSGDQRNPDDVDQILLALENSLEALALSNAQITKKVMGIVEKDASSSLPSGFERAADEDLPPAPQVGDVDPFALWNSLRQAPEAGVSGSLLRSILDKVELLFLDRKALLDISIPAEAEGSEAEQPKIVLVGDTHGQINDVLWILHRHGPPSPRTTYIFNGDIADRGCNAVEIFALVFAFKLRYPNNVFVLRGNHEHAQMNERPFKMGGGFADECYSKHGRWLYQRFRQLFPLLPLFAVINKQVFVVHAGLPRIPTNLERLRTVELTEHFPAPRSRDEIRRGIRSDWSDEDAIIFDSQWADPHEGTGTVPSKRGGDAIKFGPDITEHFLQESRLELVVRSHEAAPHRSRKDRPPGYWWAHGNRVLTVFSASNYAGQYQNLGAVAIFKRGDSRQYRDYLFADTEVNVEPPGMRIGDMSLDLDQFYAPALSVISARILGKEDHVTAVNKVLGSHRRSGEAIDGPNIWTDPLVPNELLHYAVGIMCTHRERLWSFCHKRAEHGQVAISDLAGELAKLCEGAAAAGIPWSWLLREEGLGLANSLKTPLDDGFDPEPESSAKNTVDYERLLGRFYVHWPLLDEFEIAQGVERLRRLIHKVLFAELTPKEARDLFDVNANGSVGRDDCLLMLQRLIPELSERQIDHILDAIPWRQEPMPVERCLLYLHLKFDRLPSPADGFLSEALPNLMKMWSGSQLDVEPEVVAFGERLFRKEFHEIDLDGNGLLSKKELFQHLYTVLPMQELGFNADRDRVLFEHLDVTRAGTVNIFELFRAASGCLGGTEGRSSSLPDTLKEDMFCSFNALIDSHRTVLLSTCRAMDIRQHNHCKGDLSRELFMAVMQGLLQALAQSSEVGPFEMQMQALYSVLPESVRYDDLLGDFEIIDSYQRC